MTKLFTSEIHVDEEIPYAPGAAVVGLLCTGEKEKTGVIVPSAAIVRHEGEAFVYVQASDELFERRQVELEHRLPQGWFADKDLKTGQKIVVAGAQQLLSEELKGRE